MTWGQSNGHLVICKYCGAKWEVTKKDPDIILKPYPHIRCTCGYMIPLF